MTTPMQTLLPRKSQPQAGPAPQRRPTRSHSSENGSDLKSALLTVSLTLIVSFVVLRQLDVFSSGEWPESQHVKYLVSDEDRNAFQARMKSEKEGPLVIAFYSETCLACRRMRRHFLGCAEEVEEVPFFAAQVGDPKNYYIAREFDVKRIPAIIVVNPSGETPTRTVYEGKRDRVQLIRFVKNATASRQTIV